MPPSLEVEVVEVVRIPAGPLGLEGRLAYPGSGRPTGRVVVAGPHPLLGGDVGNNVVQGLLAGLSRRRVAGLAFNYRGVGDSDGPAADAAGHLAEFWATSHAPTEPGFLADLRAAVAASDVWIGLGPPLALVGYSFGCSLLPAVGAGPAVPLVLVAPTLGTHEYEAFAALPNPLLVVAPDGDFAADADLLTAWFAGLNGPKRLVRGEWDGHFFRGQEDRLSALVFDFLRDQWGEPA